MIAIDSFEALLKAAREQPVPQRFLFVFVKTVLPKDANEGEAERYQSGLGGGLTPVMYVDKAQDELTDFASLVDESRNMSENWDIVLAACLSGRNGRAPSSGEAEEPLKNMIRMIHTGGKLDQFASFDRYGTPVFFE